MSKLSAAVQGALADPVLMRRVNGWMVIFWFAMTPVTFFLGLLSSVIFVSFISIWALVVGHWSAWQSARVEVNQENDARVKDVLEKLDDQG